jgi:hypothetical protein
MKQGPEVKQLQEKRIFSDPTIPAAFEASGKNFTITPRWNPEQELVDFTVEGTEIDAALDEIYRNAPVPVLSFIRSLKSLRSAIFTLKKRKD